jgi:hypothetical protein
MDSYLGIFLKLIGVIFASFILIHVLSIFGVFLAVAFPIWWIILPERTPCLLCKRKRAETGCRFCAVDETGFAYTKTFFSAVLTSLVIITVSALSLGVVYLEGRILSRYGVIPPQRTATFVIPPKGQYRIDEVFTMDIEIAGISTSINAVQADLAFDPKKLEIVNILEDTSFASIFIQKDINNNAGYARLTGGLPNPGYFNDRGVFGTAYLVGREPGLAQLEFLPSSMVLANDGKGTNLLRNETRVANFLILPDRLTEEEKQQQIKLYADVLGATKKSDKLILYGEEGGERVLGTGLSREAEAKSGFFDVLFTVWRSVIDWILRFWWDVYLSLSRFVAEF